MTIYFTKEDKEFIEDYAKRFLKHKGEEASLKHQQGNGDPLQYDIKGYAAEFAVHKMFGVQMPDFNKHYTKKDMVLSFNGRKLVCDIKSTVYYVEFRGERQKVLTVSARNYEQNLKEKKVDAYIAVNVDKDVTKAEILGIISWEKFLELESEFTFNNGGKAPCVPVLDLTEISSNFRYIES